MYCYAGKLLFVDLSTGEMEVRPLPEEYAREYLGGPGLGARIKDDQSFQDAFQNKQIFDESGNVALSVLKKGKEGNLGQEFVVEAVTGATLTSNGVNDMIQAGLKEHADEIKAFAGGAAPEAEAIPEVDEYEKIETIDKPIEPKVEEMED